MGDLWRTRERSYLAIGGPGKVVGWLPEDLETMVSGHPLGDLGRSVCGHSRTWEGQQAAVGGPGKFRMYCVFQWLIEGLLCLLSVSGLISFLPLTQECFSVGYTCHLDWEIICFPGHLASFDSSTKSPNSKPHHSLQMPSPGGRRQQVVS